MGLDESRLQACSKSRQLDTTTAQWDSAYLHLHDQITSVGFDTFRVPDLGSLHTLGRDRRYSVSLVGPLVTTRVVADL